ncbi:chemotaxis protein CheB [Orrella sp. JC864]|uniref:chemotaxis protein CheB n=1 Tax=Orrella sp. JC864 TaxID=3120298 RepID=UPI0012BC6051
MSAPDRPQREGRSAQREARPARAAAGIELVAMGASAGGVEALGVLLAGLPAGFPAAVAIVLHIPPDRASLLAELYETRCALPIKEVEDKEAVEPGHVYFAAPNYHMLIEPDRSFALSCDEPVNHSRPSIDLLMESAACAYGERTLGIVLTGASADGAQGLACIRRQGGMAWVQDPDEASAAVMPRAAIELAGADRILTLREMAAGLARLADDPPSLL